MCLSELLQIVSVVNAIMNNNGKCLVILLTWRLYNVVITVGSLALLVHKLQLYKIILVVPTSQFK